MTEAEFKSCKASIKSGVFGAYDIYTKKDSKEFSQEIANRRAIIESVFDAFSHRDYLRMAGYMKIEIDSEGKAGALPTQDQMVFLAFASHFSLWLWGEEKTDLKAPFPSVLDEPGRSQYLQAQDKPFKFLMGSSSYGSVGHLHPFFSTRVCDTLPPGEPGRWMDLLQLSVHETAHSIQNLRVQKNLENNLLFSCPADLRSIELIEKNLGKLGNFDISAISLLQDGKATIVKDGIYVRNSGGKLTFYGHFAEYDELATAIAVQNFCLPACKEIYYGEHGDGLDFIVGAARLPHTRLRGKDKDAQVKDDTEYFEYYVASVMFYSKDGEKKDVLALMRNGEFGDYLLDSAKNENGILSLRGDSLEKFLAETKKWALDKKGCEFIASKLRAFAEYLEKTPGVERDEWGAKKKLKLEIIEWMEKEHGNPFPDGLIYRKADGSGKARG